MKALTQAASGVLNCCCRSTGGGGSGGVGGGGSSILVSVLVTVLVLPASAVMSKTTAWWFSFRYPIWWLPGETSRVTVVRLPVLVPSIKTSAVEGLDLKVTFAGSSGAGGGGGALLGSNACVAAQAFSAASSSFEPTFVTVLVPVHASASRVGSVL